MISLKSTAALAATVLCCAGFVYAEEKGAAGTATEAKAARPTTAPAAIGPASAPSNEPAVTVNGKVITEGQIDEMLQGGRPPGSIPAAQLAMMKQRFRGQIVDMLIDAALLQEQAAKEKVTVDEKDYVAKAEQDMDQIRRQQSMSKEDMVKIVKERMQMEYKDFIAKRASDPMLRSRVLQLKLLQKKYPDRMKVTEAEIKEYYDKNLDREYKQEPRCGPVIS